MTTPAQNPQGSYFLILGDQLVQGGAPVDPAYLYRLHANVSSTNVYAHDNPGIILGLNGRATGTGWGFTQYVDGYIDGPAIGQDISMSGYLRPVAAAPVPAQVWVLDMASGGGAITFSDLLIERIDPGSLVNPVVLHTETTFTRTDDPYTGWSYFDYPYPGMTNASWSAVPPNNTSGADLVISANTAGSTSRQAFAEFGRYSAYTPTAGKLVMIEFAISSNATAVATPDVWLSTSWGAYLANLILNRIDSPNTGPTSTVAPYYVVFEAPNSGLFSVAFRAMAERPETNGDIRLHDLTITEYDPPQRLY
jgi:hypothetical protein